MTPLTWILLNASLMASLAASLRWIQARARNTFVAMAANYAVAAVPAAVVCFFVGAPQRWMPAVGFGVLTGCFYTAAVVCILRNMRQRGMALSIAIGNLSMIVVVSTAYLFGERLTGAQLAGVGVGAAAIPLLSLCTAGGPAIHERPSVKWAVLLFFIQGGAMTGNYMAHKCLPSDAILAYILCLFATAFAAAMVLCLLMRSPSTPKDVGQGAVFGVLNFVATFAVLVSLRHVPGAVLFPARSVLSLSLGVLISVIWWRERIQKWGWVGFALTIVATVLLSLRKA